MNKITFTPTIKDEEKLIEFLQFNNVVCENNFDSRGDIIEGDGNIVKRSEVNTYHFSEWFESMEQLSKASQDKAYELLSEYDKERFLPEWYYDLKIYKSGEVELVFKTDEIAIDISNSGPYEYIKTPQLEEHLKQRIEEMYEIMNRLNMKPKIDTV